MHNFCLLRIFVLLGLNRYFVKFFKNLCWPFLEYKSLVIFVKENHPLFQYIFQLFPYSFRNHVFLGIHLSDYIYGTHILVGQEAYLVLKKFSQVKLQLKQAGGLPIFKLRNKHQTNPGQVQPEPNTSQQRANVGCIATRVGMGSLAVSIHLATQC